MDSILTLFLMISLPALREVKTEKVPVVAEQSEGVSQRFGKSSELQNLSSRSTCPLRAKVFKRIEPENHFKSIRNLVKLQKEKLKTAEEKKVPESLWGLPKAGYLKKVQATTSM
jgi:hypothetical protein